MLKNYSWAAAGLAALLSLNSCAVYTPMQAAAPAIKAQGELEVATNWSLTNRLEAGITYSPLPHLLVRAATSTKGGGHTQHDDSTTFSQANQYELGLGTYWPLGEHWLVGGLLGFGQAHAEARYAYDGEAFLLFGDPEYHRFDAIYSKYSGEVYGIWQAGRSISLGLSWRMVQLRLTDVTDNLVPVRSAPILRYEPMGFFRVRPQRWGGGLVSFQVATGISDTFGFRYHSEADRADHDDPARQFKLTRGYVSVGVSLYPHLLWRK